LVLLFPYIIYFFIVFLPFLPFSFLAVLAFGLGFIMLTPLTLFMMQMNTIVKEFQFFRQNYSSKMLSLTVALFFLIIPITITGINLYDRSNLTNALANVYEQHFNANPTLNQNALRHTLNTIKTNKKRNPWGNEKTPFLSAYYNWIVLDNLVLSETKIQTLERIYFGKSDLKISTEPLLPNKKQVKIVQTKVDSHYDKKQGAWLSTINFELKNEGTGNEAYETFFELPAGCFISNYYLYIGKKKEAGILAEKKAALWIFNQIRNERRDPGILYYLSGNNIAFKVFPFAKNEVRKTGIEFIHKEQTTIKIDGQTLLLGKAEENTTPKVAIINGVAYTSAAAKAKLQKIQRKPAYHFVMDVSIGKEKYVRGYISRVENYLRKNKIKSDSVTFHFTGSANQKEIYRKDWKEVLRQQDFNAGFYLGGTINQILWNSYHFPDQTYPLIIVVTNKIDDAIFLDNFANLKMSFPEEPNFYELESDGKIWTHSYLKDPVQRLAQVTEISLAAPVYAWPNVKNNKAFLPTDSLPTVLVDLKAPVNDTPHTKWLMALSQQRNLAHYYFGDPAVADSQVEMVKESFRSHILSPFTSFLVVENEAQKIALKRKQEQVLSGNKNLDPDEDTPSMSEPNLCILIGLVLLGYLVWRLKNSQFAWPR
jgi:hypothetical protein